MSLKARAQDKVERAGISNYTFDQDVLVMCGVRYTIESCDCGEPDCDGVRLNKNAMSIGNVRQTARQPTASLPARLTDSMSRPTP